MKRSLFRSLLRKASYIILFLTAWLLWPREMSSIYGYRDGFRLAPDYRMVNSRYVSVKSGRKDLEAVATQSSFDFVTRRMDGDDVTIYTYRDDKRQNKITAKHGTFFMNERRYVLTGDVLNETLTDHYYAKSQLVNYHMNDRIADTPGQIEIWNQDRTMQMWGDRSRGDLGTEVMWLYGNAHANYLEPHRGLTKIRGDEAELIGAEDRANFYKNVKTEQGDTVGTSEEANLYYAPTAKNVRYLTLRTDVKITEAGGRYTRSQVASFSAPTDTVTLTGFPSVYDGDDTVSGDKITLYRATGVVEVTSTNALGSGPAMRSDKKKTEAKRNEPLSAEDKELLFDDETTESGKSEKKF